MELPDWRTSTAGAKVRAALWLASEIREGGTFTKSQLREAFPNIEQVDRRMRDLRPEGWKILTFQEDRSLEPEELRLHTIGGRVWERGYRSRAKAATSDKERQAVFLADDYQCVVCGVSGGEAYSDDPGRVAKLTVSRVEGQSGARTLCDRCRAGRPELVPIEELRSRVESLDGDARRRLGQWISRGKRGTPDEERIWLALMQHPAEARRSIAIDIARLARGSS